MRKMPRGQLPAVFLICCIAAGLTAAIIAGGLAAKDLWSYRQAQEEYDRLQASYMDIKGEKAEKREETQGEREKSDEAYPRLNINFAGMQQINPDLVGVLYIPSLELCYPVVQGKNDTEYLKKAFYGRENSSGCIFMDTATSPDLSDSNTFLFGHNMKDGSMFGSLKRFYQEENLCKDNPYIYFYSEKAVRKYEIFSYYVTEADSDAYQGIADEAGYDAYVQRARNRSVYTPELDLDSDSFAGRPALLTLSTCSGAAGGTQRFLVHGVYLGEFPL